MSELISFESIEFNPDSEVMIGWVTDDVSGEDVGTLFQVELTDTGNFITIGKYTCERCGEDLTTQNVVDMTFPAYCISCDVEVD